MTGAAGAQYAQPFGYAPLGQQNAPPAYNWRQDRANDNRRDNTWREPREDLNGRQKTWRDDQARQDWRYNRYDDYSSGRANQNGLDTTSDKRYSTNPKTSPDNTVIDNSVDKRYSTPTQTSPAVDTFIDATVDKRYSPPEPVTPPQNEANQENSKARSTTVTIDAQTPGANPVVGPPRTIAPPVGNSDKTKVQ
jgi:hypothetical protein